MKNLTVGIFHDEQIGRELGRKGTQSDIVMFNRKKDECVFTFMYPLEDKVSTKSQIISNIDVAIISFTDMTPGVGETVLMLDSFGISNGIIISPPYTDKNQITAIIGGTSLESFVISEGNPSKMLEILEGFDPERDVVSPTSVVIDHSFSVKGVGEVILGFVKKGIVKKHDKLVLYPLEKEVVVRSIQVQDKDFNEAEAGSRIGLAIKGATAEEMKRGSVICSPNSIKTGKKIELFFERNSFYSDGVTMGVFHVTCGMQTVPVEITEIGKDSITIESEKPIVYHSDDKFLLLNLNARKLHLIGTGKAMDVT